MIQLYDNAISLLMRFFCFVLVLILAIQLSAQTAGPPYPEIEINLNAERFSTSLPFDTPFYVYGAINIAVSKVEVTVADGSELNLTFEWKKSSGVKDENKFYVLIPALKANKEYAFEIALTRLSTNEDIAEIEKVKAVVDIFTQRSGEKLRRNGGFDNSSLRDLRTELEQDLFAEIESFSVSQGIGLFSKSIDDETVLIEASQFFQAYLDKINEVADGEAKYESTLTEFAKSIRHDVLLSTIYLTNSSEKAVSIKVRSQNHVTFDFGVAGMFRSDEFPELLPYYGANIYFVPINKDVPVSSLEYDKFLKRTSLTIGITLLDFEKSGEREGLFNKVGLVTGVGVRLTNVLRVGGGAVLFKQHDDSPLIDNYEFAAAPYFSLSVDLDAFHALGEIAKKLLP